MLTACLLSIHATHHTTKTDTLSTPRHTTPKTHCTKTHCPRQGTKLLLLDANLTRMPYVLYAWFLTWTQQVWMCASVRVCGLAFC